MLNISYDTSVIGKCVLMCPWWILCEYFISIMFSVSDPQTNVYWRLDYRRIFRTE